MTKAERHQDWEGWERIRDERIAKGLNPYTGEIDSAELVTVLPRPTPENIEAHLEIEHRTNTYWLADHTSEEYIHGHDQMHRTGSTFYGHSH